LKQLNALVIGANGGIGKEAVVQLCAMPDITGVYTAARQSAALCHEKQHHDVLDTSDDQEIRRYIQSLRQQKVKFSTVICCSGVLHQSSPVALNPEKRLEDIHSQQLMEYFRVNSITPTLWLKHLPSVISRNEAKVIVLSARVGSISDNRLGGWYGYRASKAALNMVVKTAAVEYKRRLPNTSLVCYHPGTVDTALSKPYQANVTPGKLFSAEFSVSQLLQLISGLHSDSSPHYIDWEGKTISW
jgi:NAD(P)-dependent dehydrogenase (short-subunit alcohol dehydrogenase family)